jgi:transposase InsO family protein
MRRFEAARPGEIWQMDVAYLFIPRIPVLYLVVIIDDHSRFCVAAELCHDQRAQTLAGVLHEACIRHGIPHVPQQIGSGFLRVPASSLSRGITSQSRVFPA